MARVHDDLDVAAIPELARLREVRESGEPRVLRDGDEALALVVPIDSRSNARRRVLTEADRQAFRDSAGSWKGLIDADRFLADNAESRRMPSPRREKTEADYASFRSAAGNWKGTIDADQFIKDNNESRRIDTRPPVDR